MWRMTLKNNRAPLLSNIKLYASFHHHMLIQIGVTVRKRLNWVVTSVTLTFDLWLWPFAWTLLWSLVITPEKFLMIRWWEHSQKGVTDRQTDGRTDGRTDRQTDGQTENTICRAAWSQLKNGAMSYLSISFGAASLAMGQSHEYLVPVPLKYMSKISNSKSPQNKAKRKKMKSTGDWFSHKLQWLKLWVSI